VNTPKFDAATYHDEGYQAHMNCDAKETDPYARNTAEWAAWNGGFEASEVDFENGEE